MRGTISCSDTGTPGIPGRHRFIDRLCESSAQDVGSVVIRRAYKLREKRSMCLSATEDRMSAA